VCNGPYFGSITNINNAGTFIDICYSIVIILFGGNKNDLVFQMFLKLIVLAQKVDLQMKVQTVIQLVRRVYLFLRL